MVSRTRPNVASCLLLAAGLALSFAPLRAHDIPSDVTVRMFLKPDGNRAQLLVRAPLAAMNELEWPARGVFLDLERAEPVLREAATRWVADRIDLYENDRRLPRPRLVAFVAALPSDTSFDDFDRARTHITGAPLPADTEVATAQVLLDVLFEYPLAERAVAALRRHAVRIDRPPVNHHAAAAAPRRRRSARSSFTATPVSCRWTRAGSRRRGDLWSTGSSTSSVAWTTCCFSSAW